MNRSASKCGHHLLLLLLVAPPPTWGEEAVGRLFFTPERRVALDRARRLNIEEQQVTQQAIVTVDGAVRRSSGRTTAWINGAAVPEGGLGELRAIPSTDLSAVHVRQTGDGFSTVVVGTGLNRNTGEHVSPLGGGLVTRGSVPREH